jgi:hypothetical protein
MIERGLGGIARRRGLSITLVGLLALGGSAALSLLGRVPEPRVHDEFSYLLAEVLSFAEEDAGTEIGPDLPIDPCCTSF